MFPVWSSATIAGIALKSVPGFSEEKAKAVAERARTSGAEVIRLKGGAGSAVGVSIRSVVHAVLQDTGQVLPVSTLQSGIHGIHDVCLSVPTRVGRAGVIAQLEPALDGSEKQALAASAEHLKATLAQVG
jgi:L-lactate dehydrogenase